MACNFGSAGMRHVDGRAGGITALASVASKLDRHRIDGPIS